MWFSLIYRELPQIDAVDMISVCRCGGVTEPKLDFSYPPLWGLSQVCELANQVQ